MPPKPIGLALWQAFVLYFLVSRARAVGNQSTTAENTAKKAPISLMWWDEQLNDSEAADVDVFVMLPEQIYTLV